MTENMPRSVQKPNLPLLLIALLLIGLSLWRIAAANAGIRFTRLKANGLPLTLLTLAEGDPSERPLVLVAHGFAGSEVLMRGFSLTLVHAGYTVAAWDFAGHGANPAPLDSTTLIQASGAALQVVTNQRLADASRLAVLGHSMGSGVALEFGTQNRTTAATIAISPVLRDVTTQSPANLLLMAGALEQPFLDNARQILDSAGGSDGDLAQGNARSLVVIPGVEHISILFSQQAHAEARRWLDSVFGPQNVSLTYQDLRMLWYALGVLGLILLGIALSPLTAWAAPPAPTLPSTSLRLLALSFSALITTILFWLLGRAGLPLGSLFGLLVGGYLMLWFLVAGVLAFLILRPSVRLPARRELLGGLLVFSVLWLGIGLLGHYVWLHWLLVLPRLLLWPLGGLFLLPWFYLMGTAAAGKKWFVQSACWLAHSAILVAGLYLAAVLTSDLHFLLLILPVFPLALGLHALLAGFQRSAWAFAVSGAFFTSWILLAVFPLA